MWHLIMPVRSYTRAALSPASPSVSPHPRLAPALAFCLALLVPCAGLSQDARSQETMLELSPRMAREERVSVSVITETLPVKIPKAAILVLPTFNAAGKLPDATKFSRNEPAYAPLSRSREALLLQGFALAWMGWPVNAQLGKDGTAGTDMQDSVSAVIHHIRTLWPDIPLVLAGTRAGASTALAYALRKREHIDALLALSPHWLKERDAPVESLKGLKALVVHDTTGQCLTSSNIEVEEISMRAGFIRIPAHYDSVGRINDCGAQSPVWLAHAVPALPELIGAWLDGATLPAHLGSDQRVASSHERVLLVDAPSGKLEITLFTPPGAGPFPLVVYNHGDIDMERAYIRHRQRYREFVVSAPFLERGFAVAIPARPGIGRSSGRYFRSFAANDADPTYKPRYHSQVIAATLAGLRNERDLDLDRVLLSGQSAGGYAVMYANTLALPGVRGIINFSGGRSNTSSSEAPSFENTMMIRGWAEIGKSARAPVLLVFAENDSRYSANTIRKSAQAFTEAGGSAQLLLLPAQPRDGHFVHQSPKLWTPALDTFLARLDLGLSPPKQEPILTSVNTPD